MKKRIVPPEIRFFRHIKKTCTCWLWFGKSKHKFGYGKFDKFDAHRFSYKLHNGEIPKNMLVLHRCDIPACVNPKHLYLGTAKENTRDMMIRSRFKKGTELPQSKFTEKQINEIRKSYTPYKNSFQKIATKYGVCRQTIEGIIYRKSWAHVS